MANDSPPLAARRLSLLLLQPPASRATIGLFAEDTYSKYSSPSEGLVPRLHAKGLTAGDMAAHLFVVYDSLIALIGHLS